MIKKTIAYVDYDNNERLEEHHFHLNKAEIIEMEYSTFGGMEKFINKIIEEEDTAKIIELFKTIIHKSYGKKSLDGKTFIKNEEILNDFIQSEAYSELFYGLIKDPEEAAAFIKGLVPDMGNASN